MLLGADVHFVDLLEVVLIEVGNLGNALFSDVAKGVRRAETDLLFLVMRPFNTHVEQFVDVSLRRALLFMNLVEDLVADFAAMIADWQVKKVSDARQLVPNGEMPIAFEDLS